MGRTKKAKAPEEDEDKLTEIYTNKNFSAPAVKPLETISEVDSGGNACQDEPPTNQNEQAELPPPQRSRRAAAAAARASMAPKEVRKLDFVPYHVADKERDKRRRQRAIKMTKSQGKKPLKFKGISEQQEDKLIRLIADKDDEEDLDTEDEDTAAINRAIDKALMKSKAEVSKKKKTENKESLAPANVTASASKRINTKRRRSSATFQPQSTELFNFPDFSEEDEDNWRLSADIAGPSNAVDQTTTHSSDPDPTLTSAAGPTDSTTYAGAGQANFSDDAMLTNPVQTIPGDDSRRASFESAIRGADLMCGPIDDGTDVAKPDVDLEQGLKETAPHEVATNTKVFQKVRRSSRFFRSAASTSVHSDTTSSEVASNEASPVVGSIFTQVQVVPRTDRRKSRRTNFVVYQQKEEPRSSEETSMNRSSKESLNRSSREPEKRGSSEPEGRNSFQKRQHKEQENKATREPEKRSSLQKKEKEKRSSYGPAKSLTAPDCGTPQRPPLSPIENFSN